MCDTVVLLSRKGRSFSQHKLAAVFQFSICFLTFITIVLFYTNAHAAQVKVKLDPSLDERAIGHNLYYCQSTNFSITNFSKKINIGGNNEILVSNLEEGVTYYFAATAYDISGNESVFSNIASYKVVDENSTFSTIPRNDWRLVYVNSEETIGEDGRGMNAFDGNPDTIWHSEWLNSRPPHPHEIQIDLGATYELENFLYLPRQDGNDNGRIKDYLFYVSNDPVDWGNPVASGTFANSASEKTVVINSPAAGRYIRLVALNEVNGKPYTSLAEINVAGTVVNSTPSVLIPRNDWSLVYVNSQELVGEDGRGVNAFDGNPGTFWHSEWFNKKPQHPHEIQIDLGATYELENFLYLPRQDGSANGRIKDYVFYVSNDSVDWGNPVASGTFANSASEKTVVFNSPAVGRYIRLVALNEVNGRPYTSLAEINVAGTLVNSTPSVLIPRNDWSLVYVNSQELVGEDGRGVNAFDGNPDTIWHSEWLNSKPPHPHEIQIDLGAHYELENFLYLPRQDGSANGRIKDYVFYVSNDPVDWGNPVASGTFANSASEKTVVFNSPAVGRYIRLVALNEVNGRPYTSLAEINVAGAVFTSGRTLSNQESMLKTNTDSNNHFIELGEVFVDHNWQRVDFWGKFISPIVVAKPVSANDPNTAIIRIRNVDETGFDIRIQAWENPDDIHDYETVSYIAVEKGAYVLPGEIMMEAGTFQADKQNFLFNPFVNSFNHNPVVLASVTSFNRKNPIVGRLNNISRDGFEYYLKQNESIYWDDFGETISYIACEPFSGVLNGTGIEVGTTGAKVIDDFHYISYDETFQTVPHFLADGQTYNDPATVNVRYRNKDRNGAEVRISREQMSDTSEKHMAENIGFIIISEQ